MIWEKVLAQGGAGAFHANGELRSEPAHDSRAKNGNQQRGNTNSEQELRVVFTTFDLIQEIKRGRFFVPWPFHIITHKQNVNSSQI